MNIGLIANDSKKKLMQNLCIAYKGVLSKHTVYATETTGTLIEQVTNLSVHKFLSGELGGEQQLASQVEHHNLDLLIYLKDTSRNSMYNATAMNILHLCDLYNIPIATNLATAELIIRALDSGYMDWI
ncbi:MAG: methylglyoxal synthase [Eubacteriales bacterium]|nr:methylglyoxal synthase [Eubacteriales bacterium]